MAKRLKKDNKTVDFNCEFLYCNLISLNCLKILTIKDVDCYDKPKLYNYILIITVRAHHTDFFCSVVESPVFALHERDFTASHNHGMLF